MKKAFTTVALLLGILLSIYVALLCHVEGGKGIYGDKHWDTKANRYTGKVLHDGITAIRLSMSYCEASGLRDWHIFNDVGRPPENDVPYYVYFNTGYPVCYVDFAINPDSFGNWKQIGGQTSFCMDLITGKTTYKHFVDEYDPTWIDPNDPDIMFYFPQYFDAWEAYLEERARSLGGEGA